MNPALLNGFSVGDLTVRPLTQADLPAFDALCARYPIRFLTPRLNIDHHGMQSAAVRSWGAFNPRGEMVGLLYRLNNTMIAVDGDGSCSAIFSAAIDAQFSVAGVRGSSEVVSGIQAGLRSYTPSDWEDSYFMRLLHPPIVAPATLALARRATSEDLIKLAALYAEAGTMYRTRSNVAMKLADSRVFVVEEPPLGRRPARIASCALMNVEGREAGLIGGVFTLQAARGKGYAAACVAALSLDLQRDNKLACLFYENPIAGHVYRRMGYEECGRWAVLYLAPRQGQGPR